jgi:hypothetical protein
LIEVGGKEWDEGVGGGPKSLAYTIGISDAAAVTNLHFIA